VFWKRPGWPRAFAADIFAESPAAARAQHRAVFPEDDHRRQEAEELVVRRRPLGRVAQERAP
jgi:hypothetical protein